MSDVSELVVTEGRAYHRGDVVLLRVKGLHQSKEAFERARAALDAFTAKSGVEFLLLDEGVEVIEPQIVSPTRSEG